MLKNYFKIALRNILKRKLYSTINICGLAVGFAAVILIYLYLQDELSYDRFHKKAENLYRVTWFSDDPQTRTPHPMAQALVRDFPEVESAVTLSPLWGPGLTRQTFTVKKVGSDVWYEEKDVLGVDSTFFDVFSFSLLSGNPKTVLRKVGGILISDTMAKKYFGEEDPVGKQLTINNDSTILQIEGVFEDVPQNSHFRFDALVSYVTLKALEDPESEYYTWSDFGHYNYFRLTDNADPKTLESKLMPWVGGYLDLDEEILSRLDSANFYLKVQPVVDIHLKSNLRWELAPNGNNEYVYIMAAAAIFILIIANFNFMNLTTARSMERAGEIGIRKALGAERMSLYLQFLGESIIMSLLAIILAGLLVEISLPSFNAFTSKDLHLHVSNPETLLGMFLISVLVGILAGLYPSAFLSRLRPVKILKGKYSPETGGTMIRKGLVVLQFCISMFLISGFIVIYKQLSYLNNKSLGFDKEAVIVIPMKSYELSERFEVLQSQIVALEGVENLSAVSNIPGKQFNQNPIYSDSDPQNRVNISQIMVDYDIFNTLGLELVEGRYFRQDNPADTGNFVINKRAVQALNLEDPIGTELTLELNGTEAHGTVIGVVEDFNFQSLHQPIRPLIFQRIPGYNFSLLKVKMDGLNDTLTEIASIWNEFDGNFDFEYDFLDEMLGIQYAKEQKMGVVFGLFAVLAIVIACLGLAAIAAIDFTSRKKEIGIRKVLGAPSINLSIKLLKEYTIIVLIALILASPGWWLIMGNWLNNFTFRIALNPIMFLFSGLLLILISWSTLGYLTYITVNANPVDSLKEE